MGELLWNRVVRVTKELRNQKFNRNMDRVSSIKREIKKKEGNLFSLSSKISENRKDKSPERKLRKVYNLPKIKTQRRRILSMREQGYQQPKEVWESNKSIFSGRLLDRLIKMAEAEKRPPIPKNLPFVLERSPTEGSHYHYQKSYCSYRSKRNKRSFNASGVVEEG